MAKRRSTSKVPSALDQLGLAPNNDHLLTYNIETYEQLFREDSTTTYPAFMAIASVAAYWWLDQGEPPEHVRIPWWALDAIASGFNIYTSAWKKGQDTSFGEAFGMEMSGKGNKPILTKIRRAARDQNVALHVAMALEEGGSVESAIYDTAEQCRLSDKTVWRIWSERGETAKLCLTNYRTLNSSVSDDRDVSGKVVASSSTSGPGRPRVERKAAKRGTRSNKSRDKT